MYQETIQLQEALLLEEEGKIIIYNPNNVNSIFSSVDEWKNNWEELRKKFRKVSSNNLASFANFEYLIEYKFIEEGDPVTVNWVYMYGQDIATKVRLDESSSKGKYVYVLTNDSYPNICKIGKAVTPSRRVKQINGAGTVAEWKLRYALPVTDDYKVENMIHQELASLRMNSIEGSRREFFSIGLEDAIKCVETLGEIFATSKPIYY